MNKSSLRGSILYLLIALSLLVLAMTSAAASQTKDPAGLPLGKPGLKETRTTERPARSTASTASPA